MDDFGDIDTVGYWTELKLEIIKKYARAYSTILSKKRGLYHVYVDAFAGPGVNISKATQEFILGSPLNALSIAPPFKEFHLVDMDGDKIAKLRSLVKGLPNVRTYEGDCNEVLLSEIFPKIHYRDYRRGLCLLDPYKVNLHWEVIRTAGQMKSVEIFLNFPTMDLNRNILRHDRSRVSASALERMRAFWGDDTWEKVAYQDQQTLFGPVEKKVRTEEVVDAYRARLRDLAGFNYVSQPVPMRNEGGAIVYHLLFAAHQPAAGKIVKDIFDRYRKRGFLR